MKTNLIDCIKRWDITIITIFRAEIQNYINEILKSGIKFVEIGFLFLPIDKKRFNSQL